MLFLLHAVAFGRGRSVRDHDDDVVYGSYILYIHTLLMMYTLVY